MLKIISLLLIISLASASTSDPTLTKQFFFVNAYNSLSYKLMNTLQGVVAYNIPLSRAEVPQYILLNPQTGSASLLLADTMTECGHTSLGQFDRLSYHPLTSSFVYYCTGNNSLLLLDEQFSITDVISTDVTDKFTETKLYIDDQSVFILGMEKPLYSDTQTSQLIQVDVTSRQVVSTMVLDKFLEKGEAVDGFVSSGQEAYISTNKLDEKDVVTITIYSFSKTADSYQLTFITNTSYPLPNEQYTANRPVSQLHLIGDYIVTNNEIDVILFNKKGEIAFRLPSVKHKSYGDDSTNPYDLSFAVDEQVSQMYALFVNQTVIKYSINGSQIIVEEIGSGYDMAIAVGVNYTDSLLLAVAADDPIFSIVNLRTSEEIFSSITEYAGLMITNSTYCIIQEASVADVNLYIFHLSTNKLIKNLTISLTNYFDPDNYLLYYYGLNSVKKDSFKQIDLRTGEVKVIATLDTLTYDGDISQLRQTGNGTFEYVICDLMSNYHITTEKFGTVTFQGTFSLESTVQMIDVNFDTLSLTHLIVNSDDSDTTNVEYYEYDTNNGFTLKDTDTIANLDSYKFYPIDGDNIVSVSNSFFAIFNASYGAQKSISNHTIPSSAIAMGRFHDNAGNTQLIFSQAYRLTAGRRTGVNENASTDADKRPYLFNQDGLSVLPGASQLSVAAGPAGGCLYWIVDDFGPSVGLARYYTTCLEEEMWIIS